MNNSTDHRPRYVPTYIHPSFIFFLPDHLGLVAAGAGMGLLTRVRIIILKIN